MKLKKLLMLNIGLLVLSSCSNNNENGINYGSKIEENITTVSPINDKYRNYYEIFVGSFNDSNNDQMGDLKGVTLKLDYITSLGYNGIWLMPIFKSSSYHKYNADNYYEIDSSYGTLDDLKELIEEAHKRDINIILDLAINHASMNNDLYISSREAYKKYLNGESLSTLEDSLKDLFVFKETSESIKGRNFTSAGNGYNFYVEENFNGGGMPEFNFDSTFTREKIKEIIKYYLDLGIDGFRLDAVKYYYLNEAKKNIEVLNEFYNYAKSINENVYFVGECWDNPTTIANYYKSDVDSYFAFEASTSSGSFITRSINLNGKNNILYLDGAKSILQNANNHIPAPFLDNHDMSRVSRSGDYDLTKFFYGLLSMLNGTTFTYYGDEIGLNGNIPVDQNVRGYMNWSSVDKTKNCKSPYGAYINYAFPGVDEQIDDPTSILNYYKKANYLRNKFKSISRGKILDSSQTFEENELLILNKEYLDESISIVINFSNEKYYEYDYSNTNYQSVEGQLIALNDTYIGKISDKKIVLPPYSIAIIK